MKKNYEGPSVLVMRMDIQDAMTNNDDMPGNMSTEIGYEEW